jgi:hypothetical protein
MTGVPAILVLVLGAAPLPQVAKPDEAVIEAQIARLRSPNKDPNPNRDGGFHEYPAGYDLKAQEVVFDAKLQLAKMGKDAFPTLIAHGNDEGYSLSVWSATCVGHSVGNVCLDIIKEQIGDAGMRYKDREGTDGKFHTHQGYFSKYYGDNRSPRAAFKKWYKEHETKTLKEMQIEVLEWAIAREKAIGFPSEKSKELYLIPLERELDELRRK